MKNTFVVVLLIAVTAIASFAQSNTGNLVGTVSDVSGVIPGATVIVKDNQTGKERTLTTNDDGAFTLPQLDVGTYAVTVKSSGHKTKTFSDVKIDVGTTYSLDAKVEAGDISEVVTVAAGADIVNSNNGEISTTVTGRQIVELPLNGRNPLTLVLLQAGSSSNSAQNTTINGQRSSFTNITRDGINIQDNFIRANAVDFLPDRPNVDDTGEFTIVTQNAGAEAGYGASQVQLVTPRGSNEFHGAAYIYNRNSVVAANSFFNNRSGITRPFLNRNQFGGKVSGPLWFPHFGEGGPFIDKHKLFFFFGYEGFRLRQSVTQDKIILLPNARTGTFTWRDTTPASAGGSVVRSANIFTLASSLSGNPPTGIDPLISSRLLANIPTTGNNTTLGDQLNTTGLSIPVTSNTDREAYSMRFDYDANDRNSVSVVYTFKKETNQRTDLNSQQIDPRIDNAARACCYTTTPPGFQDAHTPFLALSWRATPTNAITNEVRGGWQESDPIFDNIIPDPAYYIAVTPIVTNPETGFQAQGRKTNIYNLQDNAVWVAGNHSIRFGAQFDAFRADPFGPGAFGAAFIPTYYLGGGGTPAFTLTSLNTATGCADLSKFIGPNCISSVTAANQLLAFLGGLIGQANQTFNADSQASSTLNPVPPARKLNYEHYGFYGADQWRLSPSLTLNLGLRYELYTPIREPNGLALEPVFGGRDVRTAILDPNGTYNFVGTNNGGHNFFKTDRNNFAPVVSFAWSPTFENKFLNAIFPGNGKSVVRGGYRLSYVNDEFIRAADNALIGNAGLTSTLTTGSINARFSSLPTFTAPPLSVPRTYAQNNALAGNFGTVFAIDPNLEIPGSHEFSIGYQREIGFQTAVEVRYVHSRSNNLVRGLDLNQVNILNNGFLADFNRARNNLALYGSANIDCTVSVARPNCQPLQLLNKSPFGSLTSSSVINQITAGTPGQLAFVYLTTFGRGNSFLLNNPNTGVVDLLTNSAKSRYNALQAEVRRRFANGLTFQANYTFQKLLTDAPGTGQTRFEPLIDNANPQNEFAIGDTDTTHVFNLNAIYELPFGKGKLFFNDANGLLDRLIGGWQVTSIIRLSSGAPFSITDPSGTLNRGGRSGRQTAFTTLTKQQVKALLGVFRTPCGVFFIDPKVINIDLTQCSNGVVAPRAAGTTAGVASLGFDPLSGSKTFDGQVFFNVAPGQTGNMETNFLSGPMFFNWDASIIKNIPITERVRFQVRAEAFNVMNRAHFGITGQFTQANINSSNFGRLLSAPNPRVVQFVGRIEF